MKPILFAFVLLLGTGCTPVVSLEESGAPDADAADATTVLPVEGYIENRNLKYFGQYVNEARFVGYHVGDDIEFPSTNDDIPVVAIMDGTVARIDDVTGYGGMALIDHGDVNAIYGHIDLSRATLKAGDAVVMGQFIANLGEGYSEETDGERKHLHFGVYEGEPTRSNGYAESASAVDDWLNPQDFFTAHGVDMHHGAYTRQTGLEDFPLSFSIPDNLAFDYVAQSEAINIFSLSGEGTTLERSQIFMRYFDARTFLTLSTVDVYSTEVLTVGQDYDARRYDIEKKDSIADFANQPSWRNERHMVTDFTAAEDYGRYYVVAVNPDFASEIYEDFLRTVDIIE